MPPGPLRVLLITMNERERVAVDFLFDTFGWGYTQELSVEGHRSITVTRHHQQAQGNVEAAATVMQALAGARIDHVVGFGCCGVFDPAYLGEPMLVVGASYREIGKVGRDPQGALVVGIKADPDGVFDRLAHEEMYDDLVFACDRAGLAHPRQAMVFGVDKVVTALPRTPPDPAEQQVQLADSTGVFQPLDTYLGRLKEFGDAHTGTMVSIVDMESFGFLRGADANPQFLSILRVATDALVDKNTPANGADTDVEQGLRLREGLGYLLCLLFAIARRGGGVP